MTLPLHRFLNAIYMWCVERIAEDDLERFQSELAAPVPGGPVTTAVVEQEQEQWADFAAAFGVSSPSRG